MIDGKYVEHSANFTFIKEKKAFHKNENPCCSPYPHFTDGSQSMLPEKQSFQVLAPTWKSNPTVDPVMMVPHSQSCLRAITEKPFVEMPSAESRLKPISK